MTSNQLDKDSDEKLTHFLKTHQPEPPAPAADEYRMILRRIEQWEARQTFIERVWQKFREPFQWFIPIAATAVVVFILVTDIIPRKTTVVSEDDLGIYIDNTLRMTDESDESFLPAGEKWNLFDLNG